MLRWLLALYVLAAGVPVLEAEIAHAAMGGATAVELCTDDGVHTIAVDQSGQPIQHVPVDHHAGHDCPACTIACPQHALCGGLALLMAPAWPFVPVAREPPVAQPASPPAARAPLPARGPPSLS